MARNLFFSPLFIGGALGFFLGAARGHLALVLAFFLGAQRVGGRLVGALLVLGPRALQVVEVIFPAPTSAGDLARDGFLLECLFCGRAVLNISGLPRSQNTSLPLLSMTLNTSQPLLL